MNESSANAEALRLHYLQAMGISVYYPRFQLDGARPSTACEWPFAEEAAERPAAAQPAATESRHAEVPRPRLDIEVPPANAAAREASVPRAAERTSAPRTAAPAAVESTALHFQLLLYRVDADLCVLLQLPALARAQLPDKQRQLLGNLLLWLGKPLPQGPAPIFQWPMPGLPVQNTPQEAGASMLVFLEQAAVEGAFRRVLLLGEQSGECLRGRLEGQVPQPSWQLVVTHSLDELLALPHLKRAAWQTLQPLHAALHAATRA